MIDAKQILVEAVLFCGLLWLGRTIARNPQQELGVLSLRTSFGFLPQTGWARKIVRGWGIALIFISALIPWEMIFKALPLANGYLRLIPLLALTSVTTYFLTPKQHACNLPDSPSEWIASRRSNALMRSVRADFERRKQRDEQLKLPSTHPRRRRRREKERRTNYRSAGEPKDWSGDVR